MNYNKMDGYNDDVQETYRFMDDKRTDYTRREGVETPMSLMGSEHKIHNIETFLARPMRIGNFTVNSTAAVNTTIFNFDLIKLLANKNATGKLDGFRYLRSDIDISIYVNSQPFQVGALLAWYLPYRGDSIWWSQRDSLTGKSGCLSDVLLFEDNAPMKLIIPFNHPHGFVDLVDPSHCDLGRINIDVYSPFDSNIAGDNVNVTVYARFVNVELYGPTDEARHIPLIAQMDTEAAQQEKHGVVTAISGTIKNVANALVDVPVVGAIARPISWVSGFINKVASAFGWSKPISVHTTGVFKNCPNRYMTNFNGVDTSNNMGLDADNQIASYKFFGDGDPLDFDTILTRLNYVGNFEWATKDAADKLIHDMDVHPNYGWSIKTKTEKPPDLYKADLVHGITQLGYIATFFKFWRGDIRIQFRCIKTKFHSGRLLISWRPGTKVGTPDPTVPMAYSVVWEIAENNTMSFVIPYMNPKPWLLTQSVPAMVAKSLDNVLNGKLTVHVLNKLVASSDAVVDKVKIIMEVAGEPGFSFATPVTSFLNPVNDGEIFYVGMKAQIGLGATCVDLVPKGTVKVGIEPEKMSIGEKIVSFRQLIKRFTFWPLAGDYKGAALLYPDNIAIRNVNVYVLGEDKPIESMTVCDFDYANVDYGNPFATAQGTGGIPKLDNTYIFMSDMLVKVCSIFAYNRGSVRVKFLTPIQQGSQNWKHSLASVYLLNGKGKELKAVKAKRGKSVMDHRAANVIISEDVEETGEVQFPYYSDVVYVPKTFAGFSSLHNLDYGRIAVPTPYTTDDVTFMMWRAAGDDFDCAFMMGIPVMQYYDFESADP